MKQLPTALLPSHVRPDVVSGAFLATLKRHGVMRAQLFGSFARHEERPDSDIDLFVTFADDRPLGQEFLLAYDLQRLTGRVIDVLTEIHPAFAPYIVPTLIDIPLSQE